MPTFANPTVPKATVQKIRAEQPAQLRRPSREEALEAVRTLLRWAGDDPAREEIGRAHV